MNGLVNAKREFVKVKDGCGILPCRQRKDRPAGVVPSKPGEKRLMFSTVTKATTAKQKKSFHADVNPIAPRPEDPLQVESWYTATAHSCSLNELLKGPVVQDVTEEPSAFSKLSFTLGKLNGLSETTTHRHAGLAQGMLISIDGLSSKWLVLSPNEITGIITLLRVVATTEKGSFLHCMSPECSQVGEKWLVGNRDFKSIRPVSLDEWKLITGYDK